MLITSACPCCRDFLHHCQKCWDQFHNGKTHKDYIPPKYFGESMITAEINQKMKEFGLPDHLSTVSIKPDPTRIYKEGEYH